MSEKAPCWKSVTLWCYRHGYQVKVIEAYAILCDDHRMAQEPTDNATGAAETVQLCTGRDRSRSHLLTVGETSGTVPPLTEPKDWKEVEAIIREERAERYWHKFGRRTHRAMRE